MKASITLDSLSQMIINGYKDALKSERKFMKQKAAYVLLAYDYLLEDKKKVLGIFFCRKEKEFKDTFKAIKKGGHPVAKLAGGACQLAETEEGNTLTVQRTFGSLDTAKLKKQGKNYFKLLKIKSLNIVIPDKQEDAVVAREQGGKPTLEPAPAEWETTKFVGWSSRGLAVQHLRVVLNKLMKGKHPELKLSKDPNTAVFGADDFDAVLKYQDLMGIKRNGKIKGGGRLGIAEKATLELLKQESKPLPPDPKKAEKDALANWNNASYVGWGMQSGDALYHCRLRLNKLMKKKIKPLPVVKQGKAALPFTKADSKAIRAFQKTMRLLDGQKALGGGSPGVASGATLSYIKKLKALPENEEDTYEAKVDYTADWHNAKTVQWGDMGAKVYWLRKRLNQTLYGRIIKLLVVGEPHYAAPFNKLDSNAIVKFQKIHGLLLPGWKVKGGGMPGIAKGKTLELLKSDAALPKQDYIDMIQNRKKIFDPKEQALTSYDPKLGFKRRNPDTGQLEDSPYQQVLEYYCKEKGMKAGDWAKEGSRPKGKNEVTTLPVWFNTFQEDMIRSTTWSKEEEAMQKLMQMTLTNKYKTELGDELADSVEEFFSHVGKSETNKAAEDLIPGVNGTADWCAWASNMALVKGLRKAGLKFKGTNGSIAAMLPATQKWVGGKGRIEIPFKFKNLSKIKSGDLIDYIGASTATRGHAVTVIKVDASKNKMHVVSGNAGGESIRVNEVAVEEAPDPKFLNKLIKLDNKIKAIKKETGFSNLAKGMKETEALLQQYEQQLLDAEKQKEEQSMPMSTAPFDPTIIKEITAEYNAALGHYNKLGEWKAIAAKIKNTKPKGNAVWISIWRRTSLINIPPTVLATMTATELGKLGLERM
ncbi:MAG: hypothetical protein GY810_23315 [Aureispira sp.]|nr:hypothetical protein [Aureispira sp.]